MIKPITFTNKGQQIIGMLHLPDKLKPGEKTPAITMFHGFTGNKSESHRFFVHVARALCRNGFTVLRFDFRGSGDSDGEFEDMTVPGELSDAEASLSYLSSLSFVDENRLGIIGLSMGGRVAAVLASKDRRVRFAILYSAALSPLRQRFLSGIDKASLEKLNKGEAIRLSSGWYLKKPFFDTLDSPVPYDVMGSIKCPVLIVHGDADQVVPVQTAIKGYNIIKNLNGKNELHIVKGGDHVFSLKEHTQEVIAKTVKWLKTLQLERFAEQSSKTPPATGITTWDHSKPWFHGSPLRFKVLRKGSTVTQDRELAEVFSHEPSIVSISENGIKHDGRKPGFLYRIAEDIMPGDVQPHPRSSLPEGKEWITTRDLKVELIGLTVISEDELLTEEEMASLKKKFNKQTG